MTKTTRPVWFAALALAWPLAVPARAGAEDVAIATEVAGRCTRQAPGEPAREIAVYDWLPSGATIEAKPGCSLVVALATGERWRLGPGAEVVLGAKGLSRRHGAVESLSAYPPFPRVEAPAPARADARVAAVRVRGARVQRLYPRSPAAALPDAVVLGFEPVAGAEAYRIEVEDEAGRGVFAAESATSAVTVSGGILRPGARYFWRVRTLGGVTPAARAEAEFAVLPAEVVQARRALQAECDREHGAQCAGLLAEIDRGLGLWREARDRLRAARARTPDDRALEELLSRVEAALASLDDDG